MAEIRWLGATPAENVQTKFALAVWAKSPEGSPSTPLLDYGFQPSDYTDQWTLRDGIMLAGFSKWWNGSGKTPKLDEGTSATPGGGPVTVSPTLAHTHALSQWAIPLPAQGGGVSPSTTLSKPAGWPDTLPWPPPKPDWWPTGFAWPPVGGEPPAWPTVWPPPLPAGWPTNVAFPLPPPITSLPPITTKLPTTQPPLPPARTRVPTAPAKKAEKKSSALWWVLGGVAVVGAVVWAAGSGAGGAAAGARSPNPRKDRTAR